MHGFTETAKRLRAEGLPDNRYAGWTRTFAGEEFSEPTVWCKDLMDEVAADATGTDRERYRDRFVTSTRYEHRFRDTARCQEGGTAGS